MIESKHLIKGVRMSKTFGLPGANEVPKLRDGTLPRGLQMHMIPSKIGLGGATQTPPPLYSEFSESQKG